MFALAVVVGLIIGATLGALGGGGSILTVPALVYVLGQNAHGATTASLVVVGATALAGTVAHVRAGRVRVAEGLAFGGVGIAGSILGSRLSAGVSTPALLTGFSLLMLLAAGVMALRSRRAVALVGGPVTSVPSGSPTAASRAGLSPERRPGRRKAPAVAAAASGVGLLTGFFGVGGGFLVVPALVLVLGFDMPAAVGTSLLVISINSGVSLIARVGVPMQIDWALVGVFAAAAVVAAVVASRLASIVHPRRLARVFSVLLVGVALYTLARSLPHL